MGNPNWIKGGKSPNVEGRRRMKHSSRTVKGMVERFVARNITPQKLQKMYDGLKDNGKLALLLELLPYVAPKQSATSVDIKYENMTDHDLNRLYVEVVSGIVGNIGMQEIKLLDNGKE